MSQVQKRVLTRVGIARYQLSGAGYSSSGTFDHTALFCNLDTYASEKPISLPPKVFAFVTIPADEFPGELLWSREGERRNDIATVLWLH